MRARSETLTTRNEFASGAVKGEIMSNQELTEELHKVHPSFIDNNWGC